MKAWRFALCSVLIFLAGFIPFTSAALQLVTALNSPLASPPDGNGDSSCPIISPDGRYVLFASTAANLVEASSSNGIVPLNPPSVNVYLRDRLNQTTTLVSVNVSGTGGNGNSFPTALSTNGQFALFESAASDLVANDTNNATDVFLRDVVNDITYLVSVATNGACANGVSRGSAMSPDGRFVAFVSTAPNLTFNHTNGIADVFVRDIQAGTTVLASAGAVSTGQNAGSSSEAPEITPDGRFVAFYSSATNLIQGMTSTNEIYVRDLLMGVTTWASTNARSISGMGTNCFFYNQAISDDGQTIAFEISTNSTTPTNGLIFSYNQGTGVTTTVFTNAVCPTGANPIKRSLEMTPNGQFIAYTAYSSNGQCVYLWNSQTASNELVSGNLTNGVTTGATVYCPDVDPTGRYVVFVTTDTNYTVNATNASAVLVRDTLAGTTTVVSINTNGASFSVNTTAVPALSAGGSVAFESPWANLDGRNFECDVFAFDLTNTVSELISVHDPNLPSMSPNGPSSLWAGSVSTNGQYLAFSSWANNLTPNDTNGYFNVFVRDLITGSIQLVSAATNGLPGNDLSTEPSISGNGRYVAFASAATNLVTGDATNLITQVFVRDMETGNITLASVGTNGSIGYGNSYLPQISTDGRYVLFCSSAINLAPGSSSGANNLYLRDLQAGQTYGLTQGGLDTFGSFTSYSMTPDGLYVAFAGEAGTASTSSVYVWSTALAAMIYTNSSSLSTNMSLSPDGRWLAYAAGNSLLAQDLVAGTNVQIASGSFGPRAGLKFSSDDRFLTYEVNSNVYLYNFEMGTNLLVSTAFDSTSAADGLSDSPVISANGSFVAYRSFSSNAVPGSPYGVPNILLYNVLSNTTSLASANLSGVSSASPSLTPVFSGDGQMLVLESWANDLAPQDFNPGSDVFALDVYGLEETNVTNPPPALNASLFFASDYSSTEVPVVTWPFASGQSYAVQYKDDLNDPVWHNLNGAVTFIGGQAYFDDSAPPSSQRFYRVVNSP